MAQTLHVLEAWRENLAGGGNCWALLSAGSLQGAALKCQFGFDVRCPCSVPWGHTAAELCPPSFCSRSSCHSPPSNPPGWGQPSPWGWGLAVLGFAGAPLLCPCVQCPSLMSPCGYSVPKAPAGGSFHCGGCPPKRFSHGEHDGIPADTEPWGCVCLCSGGTRVHGVGSRVGEPSFGPRGGWWVLGCSAGSWGASDAGSVCRRCRGWRASS